MRAVEQVTEALVEVNDPAGLVDLGKVRRSGVAILEGVQVERQNGRLAARSAHALVEALSGFLAGEAAPQHLGDERRQLERPAVVGVRQSRRQIAGDGGEDIEPGQVDRAKRRALRPADEGSGHRVDLFDGEVARRRGRKELHHAVGAEAIRDECRGIPRDDHALAEAAVEDVAESVDHPGVRVVGRYQLDEVHVPRWVEKMRADPMAPEVVRPAMAQRRDGQARRVGRHERSRAPMGVHGLEQTALWLGRLDDRFDDPVGLAQGRQLVETARSDPIGPARQEERIRANLGEPFHRPGGQLLLDVEEGDLEVGVDQVGRQSRAHGPCPQHGYAANRAIIAHGVSGKRINSLGVTSRWGYAYTESGPNSPRPLAACPGGDRDQWGPHAGYI